MEAIRSITSDTVVARFTNTASMDLGYLTEKNRILPSKVNYWQKKIMLNEAHEKSSIRSYGLLTTIL